MSLELEIELYCVIQNIYNTNLIQWFPCKRFNLLYEFFFYSIWMQDYFWFIIHINTYFINVSNWEWNEWINLFYLNISICSISNGTCYTWHLHYRRINGDILLHWASYFILDLFTVRKYKWIKQQNQLNTDIFLMK